MHKSDLKSVIGSWSLVLFAGILIQPALARAATPPAPQAKLPLIVILATGGTIAHVSDLPLPTSRISGAALVKSIPQLSEYARIKTEEFSRVGSSAFTPQMMVSLAHRVNHIFATEDDVSGVVVTIGSNTLEEVAYFLDLTVKSDKPVVFTAAQRLDTSLSADGPMNLLDAVRVAASHQAVGMGVLAVTDDQIQAARDVRKTISHRVETWNSGDLGDLGFVDKVGVSFYRIPIRKHTSKSEFDVSGLSDLPPVEIVYAYTGADGRPLQHAVEDGARGIVLAAFPTGGAAPEEAETAEEIAKKGIPVVDSRRGGRGDPDIGYPYLIDTDILTPQAARILLMLALTRTTDRHEIQRMFYEY
ncbi:MAG: asparaginase [Terriglobia bacterium]